MNDADACRPRAVSTIDLFMRSESVFVGKIIGVRFVCLDEKNSEVEVPCDEDTFVPYPLIEVQVKPLNLIKGKNTPRTLRVEGCGYGGWSESGETLIYSNTSSNGSFVYMVSQGFDEYAVKVQEAKELENALKVPVQSIEP